MMFFKSCPKCRGDFMVEEDLNGGPPDLACIQCGYRARPNERITLLSRLLEQRRPAPAAVLATVPLQRRAS
jgi:hypothetical protein